MMHRLVFVFFLIVYQVGCENLETHTKGVENSTRDAAVNASGPDGRMMYVEMVSCALRYDTACLVGVAEDYLDTKKQELLAQADAQVARSTGRADSENTPSHLAKTIEKLFSDLSGLFKNGLMSMFDAREGDDELVEDNEEDEEDEDNQKNDSKDVGDSRKLKKKKGPLKKIGRLIKVGVLAVVVIIKIALVIKVIEVALKFKLLLVGVGSLLMQGVKFWLDLKKNKDEHGHGHDSGIVYKSPYDSLSSNGVEWSEPGPQGEYHGRSFVNTKDYAQRLAYSQNQK